MTQSLSDVCNKDKLALPLHLTVDALLMIDSPDIKPIEHTPGSFKIWLEDELAVKSYAHKKNVRRNYTAMKYARLIKEICFARHMKANGVNVPNMLGLSLGKDLSFIAMDRFYLDEGSREDPKDTLSEQLSLVKGLGYRPFDCYVFRNSGLDKQGKRFLFDFVPWRHPEWDDVFRAEFPALYEEITSWPDQEA
jgi:hypothetical protein